MHIGARPAFQGVTTKKTCQCHRTPEGTVTCPGCAERRLLPFLHPTLNKPITASEREELSKAINTWLDTLTPQARDTSN